MQNQAAGNIFEYFLLAVEKIDEWAKTYVTVDNVIWVFVLVAALWFLFKLIHWLFIYSARTKRAVDRVLFRVALPQDINLGNRGIAMAEQMYNSLQGMYHLSPVTMIFSQQYFTFEIAASEGNITFYFSVPRELKQSTKKLINSQYPEAFVEEVAEYNIFKPGSLVETACYKLENGDAYPLKTYLSQDTDPLNELTNAFDELEKDEGAAIQLLCQPVSGGWRSKGNDIVRRFDRGKGVPTSGRLVTWIQDSGRFLLSLVKYVPPKEPEEDEILLAESAKSKLAKDAFRVSLRIITSAASKEKAKERLKEIEDSLNQLDYPRVNRLKRGKIFFKNKFIANFIFRFYPIFEETFILNTEELATIAHFPNTAVATPNIYWLASRTKPAPKNIPAEGAILGINIFRGQKKIVHILPNDRRRHAYIIGKTGMGKSTMINNMVLEDIYNGHGVGLIDPHGDLVESLLQQIPKHRIKDVVLFDPSDIDRPLGMNLLEYKTPEQKNYVIGEAINIFYKLFYQFTGPKFDHYMRNALLTLMADKEKGATIIDIPRIFSSDQYAANKANNLTNPVARAFWTDEMASMTKAQKSENIGPVVEKIEGFAADDVVRLIIGQQKSSFDIKEIMDQGKILLVNLSKGNIGELNSALLGLIFVSKFHIATMERSRMPEAKRRDFYLYIDEFQNFTTDSIATIFSEARKYRVNITVSHQYIGQLTKEIAKAVFGNVGTIVTFRVGAQDAAFLEPEFSPEFSGYDIVNLPKYNAYVKLMVNGKATPAFSMQTLVPSSFMEAIVAAYVKEISRLRYGRPRELVEKEISERFN